MSRIFLAAALTLGTAGLSSAQQCDLILDDFSATVGTLPVTSSPGWNEVGGPGAMIGPGPIDGQAVLMSAISSGSASRTLPATATNHFRLSFDIKTTDALASFKMRTQGGLAFSSLIIGSQTGYPADYAVSSNAQAAQAFLPVGQVIGLEYQVNVGVSYSLFVNGVALLINEPWPVGASASAGDPTVGTLPFMSDPTVGTLPSPPPPGTIYVDNFCMGQSIGQAYCAVNANSTGVPAAISAAGSEAVSANAVVLRMENLPANSYGYFMVSQGQGFAANPGGSQGNLCIGGAPIGRYVGPGQAQTSGSQGVITLAIDLASTPQPGGFVAIGAGETWNFQGYYRDFVPAAGGIVTNWTEGLEIQFQ